MCFFMGSLDGEHHLIRPRNFSVSRRRRMTLPETETPFELRLSRVSFGDSPPHSAGTNTECPITNTIAVDICLMR